MRKFACLALASLMLATVAVDARGDDEEGFIQLFNGKNMEGWKANENKSSWSVVDRTLQCKGDRSHLFYVGEGAPFKDFHFIGEVKTTPGSNAGIYFHTQYQEEGWPSKGFEVQVNITHSDPKKTGSLYGVVNVSDPPAKDNEWYTQEIIVKGKNVVIKVNGETVVDYTEGKDPKPEDPSFERMIGQGTFALQAHDPESQVQFRNLRVKPL